MRVIDTATQNAWLSGDYTGSQRCMQRATIAPLHAITVPYKTQVFCSTMWGQHTTPPELPNIKSIRWSRSLDNDAASCTIELYNTEPLPLGTVPSSDGDFDLPGFYTYNRGKTSWSTTRWNQAPNGWQDRIVPDSVIRTYEGYGFDPDLPPERDPHMYPSGVWLVDTVDYTHDGTIKVTCRDFGRLLLDQILYVPVVPLKHYPLHFITRHAVQNPDIVTTSGTTTWRHPAFSDSSTTPYVGLNGSVYGHRGTDAFDASTTTYWFSTGNAVPSADYSYEWIQGKLVSTTVSAVKFKVWGGPYRVYVSVYAGGTWQGDQVIPYNPDDPVAAPNGADIRFVSAFSVGDGITKTFVLPKVYTGVTRVRLTFTHLYNSGIGPYVYRAGCRDFQVLVGSQVSTTRDGGTHVEGNYGDYTDIVKLFCAYAGFYWPADRLRAVRRLSDASLLVEPAPSNDPYLLKGRAWGHFQQTGTAGLFPGGDLTVDIFDKKPVIDGINYIRDITAFNFFVDENAAVVWRIPNIWTIGNWVNNDDVNVVRSSTIVELDERTILLGLTVSMSSRNVRERVFVANVSGKVGAVTKGFNPYPTGLRRVAGWTDQHFTTAKECRIMADLIAVRQMFTYRSDKLTIAGYPGIQIDDQVRIFERVTGEGYLHYISGIDSEWDLETGKWTYSLTTNWLGESPSGNWVVQQSSLSPDTQQYLQSLTQVG